MYVFFYFISAFCFCVKGGMLIRGESRNNKIARKIKKKGPAPR